MVNPKSLANIRPWKPGESGNPGGKPRAIFKMAAKARTFGDECLEKLVEIMRHDPDTRNQIVAAKLILERGYGMPKTYDEDEGKAAIPFEQRVAMLREIARHLGYKFEPLQEALTDASKD